MEKAFRKQTKKLKADDEMECERVICHMQAEPK
jgi:hypothetical protein